MIWFLTKNTRPATSSRKLDHKREGLFNIPADPKLKTPYTYQLKFPPGIQVHHVWHTSELEPAATDPYPGQVVAPPPPVVIDGDEEWEVEKVLESRIRHGKLQYLVTWTGYNQPDWQDARIVNSPQGINTFHARYPDSPGPIPEDEDYGLMKFDHEEGDSVTAPIQSSTDRGAEGAGRGLRAGQVGGKLASGVEAT